MSMKDRDGLMSVVDRTDIGQRPLQPSLEKSCSLTGFTSIKQTY